MANKHLGRRARLLLTIAGLAIGTSAIAAPTANAGLLVKTAPNCASQVFSQPFAVVGDSANYTLVKGGNFEGSTTGWTLSKAKVVAGNSPYGSRGKALQISPGGVVTSPVSCVGLEHPTMRFYMKSSGGLLSLLSTMTVSVLVETSLGLVVEVPTLPIELVGTKWHASGRHLIVANL